MSEADWGSVEEHLPGPDTVEELWGDEVIQGTGAHSTLDDFRLNGPDGKPDHCTMKQVAVEVALRVLVHESSPGLTCHDPRSSNTRAGTAGAPYSTTISRTVWDNWKNTQPGR